MMKPFKFLSDNSKYMVRVICWDHVEYIRETDDEELFEMTRYGHVRYDERLGLIYDFTNL